jgi:flagellar M-ring protein FliF
MWATMNFEAIKSFLGPFDQRRALIFGALIAVSFAGLIYWGIAARSPDMAILYSDVEASQAQTITEKLTQMGVPFKLGADGASILAPRDRLAELRMALAENNIGGTFGNEILDNQSMMGRTNAEQQTNFKRALEGELARTINAINAVRTVRVHLVMPTRQLFEQDPQHATASVILGTNGRLPAEKVNAIRYLVASAVPDLDPNQISIIDQNGTLLAKSGMVSADGIASEIGEHQAQLENRTRDQIVRMLEQVVGAGHVQAHVNYELDTEQVRSEADVYDPDKQVVARSTTVERNDQNRENQLGGEVTVANALPEEKADASRSGGTSSTSGETSEQLDYANSRTKTTTVKESGAVKRVTVSVLVDGNYTPGSNGRVAYAARSQAEMDQITALVKNAVGFDEARNDQVTVSNMRFAALTDETSASEKPSWMDLSSGDVARLVQTLVIGGLALLALIFVVRPMLKQTARTEVDLNGLTAQLTSDGRQLALPAPDSDLEDLLRRAAQGDEEALTQLQRRRETSEGRGNLETEIDIAQIEGKVKAAAMRKVGDVVDRHPAEAAAVIRQWMQS